MASNKEVKVKIVTKTDLTELESLKSKLTSLQKEKLEKKLEVDNSKLDETNSKIKEAKAQLDSLKNPDIGVDVDDAQVKSLEKEINDLEGEKLDLEIAVADDELKIAKKEIDSMKGSKINVDIDVDDSKLKSASGSVDSVANTATGLVSFMAGKSIWDTIYGTTKSAETNKILLKNMADTGKGYEELYNKIDKTTDSSLISMQQLIPALNGIKAATGSTATTMDEITPGVASFGQYVYALTGSSAKAEQAMFDLSNGIKGAYASLDQYGITEDALMRTGLWNGKADDVKGYIAAVNEVTGSTDELMQSTAGLEALIGKAFSRGGKKIGNELLPYIKQALYGFIDLDAKTNGWLSAILLAGGQAVTTISMIGTTLHGVRDAISSVKDGWSTVKDVLHKVSGADTCDKLNNMKDCTEKTGGAWSTLKDKISSIGSTIKSITLDKLKAGLTTIASSAKSAAVSLGSTLKSAVMGVASAMKTAATFALKLGKFVLTAGANALKSAAMWIVEKAQIVASTIAKGAATIASYALAIAEWLVASPILLAAIAIVALIAALWYLYNTNESVRAAIDGFVQALWGLGESIYNGIAGAIQWLIDGFTWLWETISGFFNGSGGEGTNWLTTIIMVLMGPIGWIMLLIQNWNSIGPAVSGALSSMYQKAVNWFNQTGARIHAFASDLVSTMGNAAWNAVSSFASGISGIASAIAGELDRAWSTVVSWGQQLIQRFWQIAVDAVNALKRGLGIGSPGFMYYMVEGEINRIDDLAKNTDMPNSFGKLASSMVGEFNPQLNNASGTPGAGNTGNTLIFNLYGDMDKEERMKEFLDYVVEYLDWNNNTAGRTV